MPLPPLRSGPPPRLTTNNNINSRLFGDDLFGVTISQKVKSITAKRFLMAPFSVLSAREGDWQDRKRAWIDLGIKSEMGRGENCLLGDKADDMHFYDGGSRKRLKDSLLYSSQDGLNEIMGSDGFKSGTSIFDPVLCELCYRWFCPNEGQIIDPFSGGSVRGIVASVLHRNYWGCDLSQTQVAANEQQGRDLCISHYPQWNIGDSESEIQNAPDADFIFSCPPYGDLEAYSDNPEDLSNMPWSNFVVKYTSIIVNACARLKDDRFACFVVGNFRGKNGFYNDLAGVTVNAFAQGGCGYYNEGILVTCAGSLPVRITKQFASGKKLGKTHQNVLVFCKGDWKKASDNIQLDV